MVVKNQEINLLDILPPIEGEITQRYGRIGQGKTYAATVDVLDELKRGHTVYTNWHIDFEGFDQTRSPFYLLATLLFPWKNKLIVVGKENLKFINVDEHFITNFSKLTNCSVYLDEGHVAFDSYEMAKMSMDKRVAVLHTRHFDRAIHIISQRPTAVHRVLRANVNRFYKYEKFGKKWPFILFRRTEYQDMTDETVDEEQPLSVKLYLLNRKIARSYNSKYLRGDLELSKPDVKVMKLPYYKRFYLLLKVLFSPQARL